jgi:C_GCAxxG_C_C family probable redox protein
LRRTLSRIARACAAQVFNLADKGSDLLETDIEALLNKIRIRTENLFMTNQLMCSEAVLRVLNQGLNGGLPSEIAVRLTSGLPEGFGGSGCTCGALSAGVIALGLFLGRNGPGILNNRRVYAASKELHDHFKNHFGATCCRVLTKNIELGTKRHFQLCADRAGEVAEKAARIILKQKPKALEQIDWIYLSRTDSKMRARIKRLANTIG